MNTDTFALLGLCGDGLRCDFSTGLCVPAPGLGEPCPDGHCASGVYCDESDPMMPICANVLDDGAPCVDGQKCYSWSACIDQGQGQSICVPQPLVCG